MWITDGLFIFVWVSLSVAVTELILDKLNKRKNGGKVAE